MFLTFLSINQGVDLQPMVRRYEAALEYILLLANKKNPHLGHPRLSDKNCIVCMAYFALNNGAYGYNIEEDGYRILIDELKNA
ncbi:hypothetical protein KKB18_04140 [bacterium]|nr:hypothetical protein [bacterium]